MTSSQMVPRNRRARISATANVVRGTVLGGPSAASGCAWRRCAYGVLAALALAAPRLGAQARPQPPALAVSRPAPPTTYPQSGLEHAAAKAVYAVAVYAGLRELHVARPVAALISTVGLTLLGKGVEFARGRRPSVRDGLHDLAWSGLLVVPIATRSWRLGVALGGGLVLTRTWSLPRW